MMKPFNPRISTLIKNLEFIKKNEPCAMSKIPLTNFSGFMWLWGLRDRLGYLRIERSTKDGRSHIVWLTKEGREFLEMLKELKKCEAVYCKICKSQLKRFFRIPNKRWKDIMGDLHDQVVCRPCFKKKEKEYDERIKKG